MPAITRDLSVHPGDPPLGRLLRVAGQHVHAGGGSKHEATTVAAAEPYEPSDEELEAVRVKREESLSRLVPKKKPRKER